MPISLNHVKGVGPATAEKLASAGITNAEDLAASSPERVAAVPGFGEFRAKQVIAHARRLLADLPGGADECEADGPSGAIKGVGKNEKDKPAKKRAEKKKGKAKKKDEKKKSKKDKLKKEKGKKETGKKDGGKKKARKAGAKKKAGKKKK